MLFGLIVALALLILSVVAAFTSGMRRIGVVGILYAFLVPIFGVTQQMILAGPLHWLVETAHLAVGFGAVAFIGALSARFVRAQSRGGGPSNPVAARETQRIG
jgi:hypothetical protein